MSSSKAITSSASSASWPQAASTAARSDLSTSSPSLFSQVPSCSSSSWKVIRNDLAEASGDIVLRPPVRRVGEDPGGAVVLDQHAVAAGAVLAHLDAEERGHVGHPRRLLHVVGDDRDRVLALELVDQVLDPRG